METYYGVGETAAADWELFALRFAELLVQRDYAAAYAMTSPRFRSIHGRGWLESRIEKLHRASPGPLGPCRVDSSSTLRGDPGLIGAVYVSIGGDHIEAVFPTIVRNGGQLHIDEVDIGRP